jgi:hypothetical protein
MLNDAIKVAYNRGRFEMSKEILAACSIAETISVSALKSLLGEFEEHEDNDEILDRLVEAPHYVVARANVAFNPPKMPGLGKLPNLKAVTIKQAGDVNGD